MQNVERPCGPGINISSRNSCLSFLTWDVGNVDHACETPRRQASSNERPPFSMAAALLGKAAWLTAELPRQSRALRGSPQERACPPASWPRAQWQLTWGCSRLSAAGGGFSQPAGGPSPPAGLGPGPSHAQLCTTQRCFLLCVAQFAPCKPQCTGRRGGLASQSHSTSHVQDEKPAQMREFGFRNRERTE